MALQNLLSKMKEDTDVEVTETPSTVEEYEDSLEPDPRPERLLDTAKSLGDKVVKTRARPKKMTKGQKQKAMDNLEMLLKGPGFMLSFVDPVCGGALSDNSMKIAESMIPIIERNPSMIDWFTKDGGNIMDYVGLVWALAPVGYTMYQHHAPNGNLRHHHSEEEDDITYTLPNNF